MGFIRSLLPPSLVPVYQKLKGTYQPPIWSGNYASWAEAMEKCAGYDAENILEKCTAALLKVKNGEAIYERDSVVFDTIQYSWPLLACLLRIASENDGQLKVLDFGGSLGSTYFQNRAFLGSVKHLEWTIVEQENFVNQGKRFFESEELKFKHTVEEGMASGIPQVIILSSVLQYLSRPYHWLEKFTATGVPYILIDRTAFSNAPADLLTVQQVPEAIYKASYPAWFFAFDQFTEAIGPSYSVESVFESYCDPDSVINHNRKVFWRGFFLKKRER